MNIPMVHSGLDINNISWDKKTLDECRDQVIDNYSSFLDIINKPSKIEIVNASHVKTYAYYSIKHHDRKDGEIWFYHVIRESRDKAKAQPFTYPPKEKDMISIEISPVDIAIINSNGFTCLERVFFQIIH